MAVLLGIVYLAGKINRRKRDVKMLSSKESHAD